MLTCICLFSIVKRLNFYIVLASSNQNGYLSNVYYTSTVEDKSSQFSSKNRNISIISCSMLILIRVGIIFVKFFTLLTLGLKILTNIMPTMLNLNLFPTLSFYHAAMLWKRYLFQNWIYHVRFVRIWQYISDQSINRCCNMAKAYMIMSE